MKIFDISQEVFSCKVFPGDPSPVREQIMHISDGEICNLTRFEMCAHNGTHVDAPYHFIDGGKTIDQVDLDRFVGPAYVAEHEGDNNQNIRHPSAPDLCISPASQRLHLYMHQMRSA